MPAALLLNLSETPDSAWQAGLNAAGIEVLAWCSERTVAQQAAARAPAPLVCLAPGLTPALAAALSALSAAPPGPVLLLAPEPGVDEAARAVELGVHHWQALGPGAASPAAQAASLAMGLAWAQARWQREHTLRAGLTRAQSDLDERKWVERAKGVLMSARGMGEDEAFRLLRGAAMNVNLRLGEISRAVIEAAQWADAMNRAGQLRMLSQRLVRVAAQRLLSIDARNARTLQTQSAQRVQDNLEALAIACADDTSTAAAHVEASRQWQRLNAALAPRLDLPALLQADACANELLGAAEQLTAALQAASGRRALHIVNLCGRQRLHVQRIAKHSLLAMLAETAAAPEAATAAQVQRDAALDAFDAFEQAQRELEQAPLSSAEIRATLAQVRDEWLRLLGGLRSAEGGTGRLALVHASEVLLSRLDALTAAYEHSLQVIMG